MRKLSILVCLLAVTVAQAATPPEGVPLKVRRGFFTETDIGGFLTLGGQGVGYSNLQTYLQLGLGYQFNLGDADQHYIPLGLHVGIGANAANCFAEINEKTGECTQADNFTITFISATAGYMRRVVERLYVGGKIVAGYSLLDPAPVEGVKGGVHFGLGPSIEYATNMDHFTIGFDFLYRFVVGPNISSLQFFPRVKYTF